MDAIESGQPAAFEREPAGRGTDSTRNVIDILCGTAGVASILLPEDSDGVCPQGLPRDDRAQEAIPARIGRYQVAGEIARGGVGSIYKARDVDLGRDVAIKVLLGNFRKNPEVIRRFVEEAQIGGQLEHPGIVPVHEMGLFAGDRPYFAMKLVKGQTLAKLIQERESPSEDRQRFLGIFEHVCQTIAYAHARGVIHRDLKPSNVMVGAFGEVQVMDWGLAKVLALGGVAEDRPPMPEAGREGGIVTASSSGTEERSLAGSVFGTLAYMSPEQARGEVKDLDESTDVFGLGAILCEILTGTPPYKGDSFEEIHLQAKRGALHDAISRCENSGADPEVIALAKRCLAPEARDRPREAGAVANEIAAYLESLERRVRQNQMRAAKARLGAFALFILIIAITVAGVSIRRIELDRRDGATRRLQKAVGEAENLAGQAESASIDPAKWSEAKVAARTARSLLTDEIDPTTAAQVGLTLTRIEDNARLRTFLARLGKTGDRALNFSESAPGIRIDQDYQDAFRDFFGRQFEDMESPEATTVPSAIRATGHVEAVARALDDWALVRWVLAMQWSRLANLSLAVSPEPWRVKAWQALREEAADPMVTLEQALGDRTAPAVALTSFAIALSKKDDLDDRRRLALAESLLRRALDREPGSFRANHCLAQLLSSSNVTAQESLRHWTAVRALRPNDFGFAVAMGKAYLNSGQHEKALLEFAEALRDLPGQWRADLSLGLLERGDLSFSNQTLDEFIERIERLPASSKIHIPQTWEILAEAQGRRYRGDRLEEALRRAEERVRETRRQDHHALLMLSRILWASARSAEAIRIAEEAESIAGTPPVLKRYRQNLAPRLISCASVEAAILEAESVQIEGDAPWRFIADAGAFDPRWLDGDFDDAGWGQGKGNLGWPGVRPSNRIVLRQKFSVADPDDFASLRLALIVTDWAPEVHCNGRKVGIEGMPESVLEGRRRLSYDLKQALRAGANLVVVDAVRTAIGRRTSWLEPILESKRRPERRAVSFEALRRRLAPEEDDYRLDYLEGRRRQLDGDLPGAAERFRAVLARQPLEAAPFRRLRECLDETRGTEEAFAEIRKIMEKAGPTALLPLAPEKPQAKGTGAAGGKVWFETSGFLHLDPRVNHRATRWQVRAADGGDEAAPVADQLSFRHLTRLTLPAEALEPGKRYAWRAYHIGENARISSPSEEEVFLAPGDSRREVISINLEDHFNRDVVADRGDPRNDSIDDGLSLFLEQGYDGDPSFPGMPTDRRIGVHRLGDYRNPNAIQIKGGETDPIRIEFPAHRFDALHFLLTCGHGNANVPVILEYVDGTVQREVLHGIDWVSEPLSSLASWGSFPEGVQRIRGNMARMVEGKVVYGASYGVFDVTIEVDETRPLRAILLEADKMEGFFERTRFNLFAITGAGG